MRIGLILGIDDKGRGEAPSWEQMRAQATAAEEAGFDRLVIADALSEGPVNYWEGMTTAGALAAATTRIGISHSVVNAPMRPPALVARAAQTLDAISSGRYTLGIGAGNTPDDYEKFDIDADPRFSRFSETLHVVHALLRDRSIDFDGEFQTAHADQFDPVGPRPDSIPINVAAGGPRMLELTARYADEWNWFVAANGDRDKLRELIVSLDAMCDDIGREPSSLQKTLDVYSFEPLGLVDDLPGHVLAGGSDGIAASLLALEEFGIDEVRVDIAVTPLEQRVAAVEAMAPAVRALHEG